MPYFKCIKFRAAESPTLPENLFQQLCGEDFSLNREKEQRKVYPDEHIAEGVVGKL